MLKSIQNELTLLANTMGYSVDQFGVVRNSKNKIVRSFINGKNGNSYLVFSIRNLSLWDYAKKLKCINYKPIKNLEIKYLKKE